MNFNQEFEFTCRETFDNGVMETVKRLHTADGVTYSEVVECFLEFLSSAYGYEITLDKLRG